MKTSNRKFKKLLMALSSLGVFAMVLFFNNCSGEHDEGVLLGSQKLAIGTCSLNDTQELFSYTYHPFLIKNCAACHVPGDEGKGAFASGGLAVASTAFELIGFKKVADFALDPGHNSPYTGPQHNTEIAELNELWSLGMKELATCDKKFTVTEFVEDPWEDVRVNSRSKAISPQLSGEPTTIRWDLNNDMLPAPEGVEWPSLPGAFFEIQVSFILSGVETSYLITRPRIVYPSPDANASDLSLESIRIKLNGEEVINETTFHFIKSKARKNQDTFLSAGGMIAMSNSLKSSDVISVSFGKVERTVIPPPLPGPKVSFATTTTNVNNESGTVKIRVELDQPIDDWITVGLSVDSGATSAKAKCCTTIIDFDSRDSVEVMNYDVDYEVVSDSLTMIFEPTETVKELEVKITEDRRDEGLETVKFDLGGYLIGGEEGELGANSSHTINISDNDSAPAPGEITFAELMEVGGVLRQNCVGCHYTDLNGDIKRKYGMNTYEDLMGRVIPGDLSNDNELYFRMNNDLETSGLDPMPLRGLLPTLEKLDVQQWILDGAKNN